MTTRRRRNKGGTNKFKPMQQASSNPEEPFDWPGSMDQSKVEDIRGRLNSLENSQVTDEFIKAFLAAHNNDSRHAVEGIKTTLEFRKGRQMFYNHYRTTLQRYMFFQSCRTQGIGPASTFGHARDGRIVFYEKMENWNLPFYKEFSEIEFVDHVITWCEQLYSMALANNGQSPLIIHPPNYKSNSSNNTSNTNTNNNDTSQTNGTNASSSSSSSSSTTSGAGTNVSSPDPSSGSSGTAGASGAAGGSNNNNNNNHLGSGGESNELSSINTNVGIGSKGPESTTTPPPPSVEVENDFVFASQPRQVNPNCKYADVIGIIDWENCSESKLILNENLLMAAENIISKHFPFLVYRLIHVNMPMTFDSIFKKLKPKVDPQTILKSVFYEAASIKKEREQYAKTAMRKQRANRRNGGSNNFRNKNSEKDDNMNENGSITGEENRNYIFEQLTKLIEKEFIPKEYAGDAQNSFKKCDQMFANLIGYSAISEEDDNEENEDSDEKHLWETVPLNRGDRQTIRKTVERGQHWRWEYNVVETGSPIMFGVTFECAGFRAKNIKIKSREEVEHVCSFFPIYGDFVTLKEGKLEFQFRNVPRGKRINLKYKITCEQLPPEHVNKFLPTYQAEEKLLQMESTEHLNSRRNRMNAQRSTAKSRMAKTPQPSHKKGNFTKANARSQRQLVSDDDEPNPTNDENDE